MAIAISFGKSMILAIKSFFRIWIVNKSSPSAVHSHTAHYNWCFDVNSELNANVTVYILVSSWHYVFGDMYQWYGNVHPVIKRKTLQLCCNNDSFPFWLGSSNTFVSLLFLVNIVVWNGSAIRLVVLICLICGLMLVYVVFLVLVLLKFDRCVQCAQPTTLNIFLLLCKRRFDLDCKSVVWQ